jgi:LPXTG-motif cell wall-anchored protein
MYGNVTGPGGAGVAGAVLPLTGFTEGWFIIAGLVLVVFGLLLLRKSRMSGYVTADH